MKDIVLNEVIKNDLYIKEVIYVKIKEEMKKENDYFNKNEIIEMYKITPKLRLNFKTNFRVFDLLFYLPLKQHVSNKQRR